MIYKLLCFVYARVNYLCLGRQIKKPHRQKHEMDKIYI